jgi:hypothetical protein
MSHYLTEETNLGALASAYPHSPENDAQSQTDYLEDKLSQGYEFVFRDGSSSGWTYIFRVVAK